MKVPTSFARPFVLLLMPLMLWASQAQAVIEIDISDPNIQPLPIAVTDFTGGSAQAGDLGAQISAVIAADLERSGLFRPIDRAAFIQSASDLQGVPRFGDWRLINADALVSGAVTQQADGRLRVEFRLWDVLAEQQMAGLALTAPASNWRRIAHRRRRCDLHPHHRRRRLFRLPHRLCVGDRPGDQPDQAAGDHGPGRFRP